MRELEVDLGGPLHYVDYGGQGIPIVLIHGLGGSRVNWLAVGPELARRNRVFAIELIGHGLTPLAGRKATMANHGRIIHDFITTVAAEPSILIGNSTGGHLAIMEAALHPEAVAGQILVDPAVPIPVGGAGLPPPAAFALVPLLFRGLGEAMMMANARRTTSDQQVYRTLKLVAADHTRIPEDVLRAHLAAHRLRHGNPEANRAFLQTARSLALANLRRSSFYANVRRIKAPTLVIQGEKDLLVPMRAIRTLLEVRPDWALHVFPDLGHVPMLEDPEGFLEVVAKWLSGRRPVAA